MEAILTGLKDFLPFHQMSLRTLGVGSILEPCVISHAFCFIDLLVRISWNIILFYSIIF